jgi:putative cardiolipin synthase
VRMFLNSISLALVATATFSTALAQNQGPTPFDTSSKIPHAAIILDYGLEALQQRMAMIDRAKKSIDLEYFIYNPDRTGRMVTQALVRKVIEHPEVKVRILLDGSPSVLAMNIAYANELAKYGIQVRYYNPTSFIRIVSTQYRDHRKAFIIDGNELITGGRNIADEYFDLSAEYNFVDRDLWIAGPIVAQAQKTFDAFWNNETTKQRSSFKDIFLDPSSEQEAAAAALMVQTEDDRNVLGQVSTLGSQQLRAHAKAMQGKCNEPRFVSDEPGFVPLFNESSSLRNLRDVLIARIDAIPGGTKSYLESPYFILDSIGEAVLDRLSQRGVQGNLLTNGLGSTDAFYAAAVFNSKASSYAQNNGFKMSIYAAKPLPNTLYVKDLKGQDIARKSVWGNSRKDF